MPLSREQKLKKLKRLSQMGDPVFLFKEFETLDEATEKLAQKDTELEAEIITLSEGQNTLKTDFEAHSEEMGQLLADKLSRDDFERIKPELRGDKGETYILTDQDRREIASKITVPVVDRIIERTEVIREPIITHEIKEVALAETPEIIRDKLQTLEGEERLDISAIKGWKDLIVKETRVIGANKPLYQLLDVNVVGIVSGQGIYWNGIQWLPADFLTESGGDDLYVRRDGTTPLTANWDAGAFDIEADSFTVKSDGSLDFVSLLGGTVHFQAVAGAQESTVLIQGVSGQTSTLLDNLSNQVIAAGFKRFNDNIELQLGTAGDAVLKYDGSDLIINPKAVGTGGVNIDGTLRCLLIERFGDANTEINLRNDAMTFTAGGWDFLVVDEAATDTLTLGAGGTIQIGDNTANTLIGVFGVTPVVRNSAFTQTYATATKTHANPTATTVTDTNGTFGYALAADRTAIATAINNLIADVANTKQVLNALIDDLQLYGLEQ